MPSPLKASWSWQSAGKPSERGPSDALVEQLIYDSIAYLSARDDVDSLRIGLTGFCAGGRYTMLFMPQIKAFAAGVAWYGFPNNANPTAPIDFG